MKDCIEVSFISAAVEILKRFLKCHVPSPEKYTCYQIVFFLICCIFVCFCCILLLLVLCCFSHIVDVFPSGLVCDQDFFLSIILWLLITNILLFTFFGFADGILFLCFCFCLQNQLKNRKKRYRSTKYNHIPGTAHT